MARPLPILGGSPGSSTLKPDGRRELVVPADVSGRFTRRRYIGFALLILIYVATPWIPVGGHPAVFLDLEHRAFYLLGATFNAQDVWLAFFLLSGLGFLLIVATALWGRVWCGYACPQTVFLEGVYRRIERAIEGPRNQRLRRDQGPASASKLLRKLGKHLAFALVSVAIAHVFLSYFVSFPGLLRMVRGAPSEHPEAFAWAAVTSLLVYFNYAWFREQLCLIVCPYGRLQSVLTDADTLVIGYDVKRGEPRGGAKQPGSHGDCVDCGRCVVVCPTGIDIRNGLQLDCIGCAACVDACDDVMRRLERPEGLIRYDSQRGLDGEPRRFLRPRLALYAALGLLGLGVASFAVRARTPFEANLLRLPGAAFSLEDANTRVRNALELHLVNKQPRETTFELAADTRQGLDYVLAVRTVVLPPLGERHIPVFVSGPNDGHERSVRIMVRDGREAREVTGSFVAPH
jgi:cytochrome c oxidase accessory protein FixG